jgi:hypothetical protein
MRHYSFPSIELFRNIIIEVQTRASYKGKDKHGVPQYDPTGVTFPTIKFDGTVKLHGTNCSIVNSKKDGIYFQSRDMILDTHNDVAGFCNHHLPLKDKLIKLFDGIEFNDHAIIYGEWVGSGVIKGNSTGAGSAEKMFVVFALKIDGVYQKEFKHIKMPELRIFNIKDYKTYSIEIDFNNPEESLEMLNKLTIEVEKDCPVGREHKDMFNETNTGEGIVWVAFTDEADNHVYRFKTKGIKHSMKTGNKEAVEIDPEVYKNVMDFVDTNLSQNRLEQGLQKLIEKNLPVDIKSIGEFLKWCQLDIQKECALELVENDFLDWKTVSKEISTRARKFYLEVVKNNSNGE